MKVFRSLNLLACIIIFSSGGAYAQSIGLSGSSTCGYACVYPGDANNDGKVGVTDVFALGWAYGNTGAARVNQGNSWNAAAASNWGVTVGGIDLKHSDCNGDGTINSSDLTAIKNNFGLGSSKDEITAQYEGEIPFSISLSSDTFIGGDTIEVSISLGTEQNPAVDIYGISFAINYPAALIRDNGVYGDFDNSWLLLNGELAFIENEAVFGRADVVLTRIDQQPVTNHGYLGSVYLIVEDNLDEKGIGTIPMEIATDRLLISDETISYMNVNATAEAQLTNGTNVNNNTLNSYQISQEISAYPLPFRDQITLVGLPE